MKKLGLVGGMGPPNQQFPITMILFMEFKKEFLSI